MHLVLTGPLRRERVGLLTRFLRWAGYVFVGAQ